MIKLTGTQSFVSVIVNIPSPVELLITQVDDHVKKMTLNSELINSISRVPQKLLKYFNGTIISTFFVLLPAEVFSVKST